MKPAPRPLFTPDHDAFRDQVRLPNGQLTQREYVVHPGAVMIVPLLEAADGAMQLIVPPEGTRGKTRYWKTGFYYIAAAARVPIVLSYMDYERKVTGLGPVFVPTGDIDADMLRIKAYYAPFKGKNAGQFQAD